MILQFIMQIYLERKIEKSAISVGINFGYFHFIFKIGLTEN